MIDFMLFDPKISIHPGAIWGVGMGAVGVAAVVIRGVVKVMTKNHIRRDEAYKYLQTTKFCEERSGNIEEKIDGLGKHIDTRFDDLKDLINKNSKGVR